MHSVICFHLGKQNNILILSNFYFVQDFDHNLDSTTKSNWILDIEPYNAKHDIGSATMSNHVTKICQFHWPVSLAMDIRLYSPITASELSDIGLFSIVM